jgi:hypothetical protein
MDPKTDPGADQMSIRIRKTVKRKEASFSTNCSASKDWPVLKFAMKDCINCLFDIFKSVL